MLRRRIILATPALLYGVRMSASVCLALIVAYWMQLDNAYWAATSAAVVAQPALGASLRKGRFRAMGTVIGGIFIVALTALVPQDRGLFLAGLTLWAGVLGYLATILPNFAGYAAALAGYTAAIVFAGIIATPENVFLVTVWRVTEIGIGIFSAGLVHALTDFGDARSRLGGALRQIGTGIASGLSATLRAGEETPELRTSRRELIGRTIALDSIIDEAIGEPSHLRRERGRLQAAMQALFVALSGWRGIGNHLGKTARSSEARCVPVLLPPLARLAESDWLAQPEEIRALCRSESRRLREKVTADLSSRLLIEGVGRVLEALETVADALLATTRAGEGTHAQIRGRPYVADHLPAVLNGLRTVLALAASELIWIATSWPNGPTMITFTAVSLLLVARQPDAAAYSWAAEFGLGCFMGGIFAAILDLAILPVVHGGPLVLSLTLSLVLLPLAALSAGSWHKVLFISAATNVMPILALENESVYDAVRVLDSAVAVSAGVVIAVISVRLLPPLTPRWRIERSLRFTLRDLRELAGGRREFTQDAWRCLVSARLAALPKEASLEQEAELLATLSVGEAAIALLSAQATHPGRALLDHAFASLAEAQVSEARESLARFSAQASFRSDAGAEIDLAVQATLIAEALDRHERFFSSGP